MNFYARSAVLKKQNYIKKSLLFSMLSLLLIVVTILQASAYGYADITFSDQYVSTVKVLETNKEIQKEIVITGTITDKNGEALPGVVVNVKNTTNTTQTNIDGKYSIKVSDENAILVYSYLGFKTTERKVGNQTVINIQLSENYKDLNDKITEIEKQFPDIYKILNFLMDKEKTVTIKERNKIGFKK